MSSQRYSPEFKDEAVRRVLDRGHPVTEVAQRLGVSSHSLYKWVKAVRPDKTEKNAAELIEAKSEILKLRAQLRRTEEKRNHRRCLDDPSEFTEKLGKRLRDFTPTPDAGSMEGRKTGDSPWLWCTNSS